MPPAGTIANTPYPGWFYGPQGQEGSTAFLEKRKPNWWAIRKAEAERRQKAD